MSEAEVFDRCQLAMFPDDDLDITVECDMVNITKRYYALLDDNNISKENFAKRNALALVISDYFVAKVMNELGES